jgi:hypothetical protein
MAECDNCGKYYQEFDAGNVYISHVATDEDGNRRRHRAMFCSMGCFAETVDSTTDEEELERVLGELEKLKESGVGMDG